MDARARRRLASLDGHLRAAASPPAASAQPTAGLVKWVRSLFGGGGSGGGGFEEPAWEGPPDLLEWLAQGEEEPMEPLLPIVDRERDSALPPLPPQPPTVGAGTQRITTSGRKRCGPAAG